MAAVTITVDGADQLAASLRSAARALDDMAGPSAAAGRLLAAAAARRAPHRTGALAASIRPAAVTAAGVQVIAAAAHAPFIEYGTRHIRARPYLRPTLDSMADQVVDLYRARVTAVLQTVKGA